ncbi:MAG TPA: AI-2E family transporter, partial [Tenericutes bacterium]|nr:AI-2E family transporter [Mycoplasmatota bacterium]
PILRFMIEKNIPKGLAIFIIMAVIFGIFGIIIALIIPNLLNQVTELFNGITTFFKEISIEYDLNFGTFQNTLSETFNEILTKMSKYLSDGAVTAISISVNYISVFLISFAAGIYFLIDMDKIREWVKKYLSKKSIKSFLYVRRLDTEMKKYLIGFTKILFITVFEYSIAYTIIGHPNAIFLGLLAGISGLIPYFGGIATNIIAAVTAFAISPSLFIRTVIAFIILSSIDGYVINPLVYGKSNEVHPILVIISIFTGGVLFGIFGVIISLPVTILIISTYNYFKIDINEYFEEIKENNKKNKTRKKPKTNID